jgi:hypothetical protein
MPPSMQDTDIEIKSDADEKANKRHILEGKYDLVEEDSRTLKVFHSVFITPEPNENLIVLTFEDCRERLNKISDELLLLPEELRSSFIEVLNTRLFEFRKGPVLLQKVMLYYVVIGALALCLVGALFAIFVSFWISVVIALLYFGGLFVMIRISNKRGKLLEKKLIFNMGLVLMNLNRNPDEVVPGRNLKSLGVRLEVGHLAQWIEVHIEPKVEL